MGIDAHRRNASFRHIYYDVSQVFICAFLWYHGAGLGWFGRIWVSTFGRFGSPGRRRSRPVWKVRVCMLDPATSFRKRRDQTTLLWTLRDLARCVGSGLGCVSEVRTSIYVTGMSMDMSMIAHMSSLFLLRAVRSSAASLQVRMSPLPLDIYTAGFANRNAARGGERLAGRRCRRSVRPVPTWPSCRLPSQSNPAPIAALSTVAAARTAAGSYRQIYGFRGCPPRKHPACTRRGHLSRQPGAV